MECNWLVFNFGSMPTDYPFDLLSLEEGVVLYCNCTGFIGFVCCIVYFNRCKTPLVFIFFKGSYKL